VPPFRATMAEVGRHIGLLSVSGELDLYVERELADVLSEVEELDVQAVVVDLSGVTFLDSTICGILVGEAKKLRGSGRELALVSNDPRTVGVFDVAGITRVVRLFPTLHDALQELMVQPV
jgi:anti-sigma B factor antagonist